MSRNPFRKSVLFSLLVFVLSCVADAGFAQEARTQAESEPVEQTEDIPPPLVALSSNEVEQLKSQSDLKQRTVLCLQLADSRLQHAETLTTKADFQDALAELGGYQAVISNGLTYLQDQKDDSKKVRDNVKRLEIALRAHSPRLETIRRSTPFEYALRLKTILKFAREARSRALNLFFSDTVIAGDTAAVQVINNSNLEKKQP